MSLPKTSDARIISCDVFDTLLYRDHRSERRRFYDIAVLAARAIAQELGTRRHPSAIYKARLEVQRQAYRALDLTNPTGDVQFADMLESMVHLLSLDARAINILYSAEVAIETAQLRPNMRLLAWLDAQAKTGCRVIAVSDTYHRGETVAHLLSAHACDHVISRIYTSADHDATKRTGALFDVVLREERVAPAELLHLGDDTRADITMARAAGLRSLQLLRPRYVIMRRRADALCVFMVHATRIRAARTQSGTISL